MSIALTKLFRNLLFIYFATLCSAYVLVGVELGHFDKVKVSSHSDAPTKILSMQEVVDSIFSSKRTQAVSGQNLKLNIKTTLSTIVSNSYLNKVVYSNRKSLFSNLYFYLDRSRAPPII